MVVQYEGVACGRKEQTVGAAPARARLDLVHEGLCHAAAAWYIGGKAAESDGRLGKREL